MVGYSQDSAGFQRAVKSFEVIFGGALRKPVVNVAKRQDHVGRACRRDFGLVRRLERSYNDLAIDSGIGLELLLETLRARSHSDRLVKLAVVLEKWGEDLGIPAGAGRDLNHRHIGLNPEEGERLQRMAIFVAGLVCLGTIRPRDRGLKRGVILSRRRNARR